MLWESAAAPTPSRGFFGLGVLGKAAISIIKKHRSFALIALIMINNRNYYVANNSGAGGDANTADINAN